MMSGGRRSSVAPYRGKRGGEASNRRQAGQERLREDIPAWEGLKMVDYMTKHRKEFATEADYWKAMCRRYRPKPRSELEDILAKEDFWRNFMKENETGTGGSARKKGCTKGTTRQQKRGCRKPGGGSIDHFKHFKEQVKAWAIKERSYGHILYRKICSWSSDGRSKRT